MKITKNERRFLQEFQKELHKVGSDGWLDFIEAGKRCKLEFDDDDALIRLRERLKNREFLVSAPRDPNTLRITPRGEEALLPWWRRNLMLLLTAFTAVVGWILWVVERFVLE